MPEEIINRVARSPIVTFDLEELYPEGKRVKIDIKEWLYEGLILREKEFRKSVADHNWAQYENAFVAIDCSSDAIIPGWAYMLITSKLAPYARRVVHGSLEHLETAIYQHKLDTFDFSSFKDKPVIIKGCSNKPVPQNAYLFATAKIQQVAKSVMYGEACSAVPIYKRK
ncbi:MAG: DUF2480 family protein [Bacteroidota bacterium]